MATEEDAVPQNRSHQAVEKQPTGNLTGLGFDWTFVALCAWLVGGGITDNWAHRHIPTLETFFTPWHAILYTGYIAVASFLVLTLVRNHAKGYPWLQALPPGYEVSLLGVVIFAIGGISDLIWHILFGIERDVEALLSPTILLQTAILMGCVLLIIRRWALPFGSLTLIFALSTLIVCILSDQYRLLPAAFAAGLIADVFLWRLKPSVTCPWAFRLFAYITPVVLYLLYFLNLMIVQGVSWSIHLWMGSAVLAGGGGLLVSYLLLPPFAHERAD